MMEVLEQIVTLLAIALFSVLIPLVLVCLGLFLKISRTMEKDE